ncbi:MAG: DUF2207 domain-containing protein [Anaerolineae bacterium]
MRYVKPWLDVLVFFALALAAVSTVSAAAKTYGADRFDVDIVVAPDGSADVTETITLRFQGGPFTYAFRGVPTRFTGGLSNFEVSENGVAYTPGNSPGHFATDVAQTSTEVRWFFDPTTDASRTFTLRYRVKDLVRLDEGQANVRWGAVPPNHDYPIAASRVTVRLPANAPIGHTETWEHDADVKVEGSVATFDATKIGANQQFVVGVWAPAAAFSNVPPAWQRAEEAAAARQPVNLMLMLLLSGATLLLGALGLLALWRQLPPLPRVPAEEARYTPPDNLPPALAASIVRGGYAPGTPLATLFDLAERGVLRLEELPKGHGIFDRADFALVREESDAPLAPFEAAVIEAAYAKANNPVRVLSHDLGKGLQSGQSAIKKAVEESLTQLGLLDPTRQKVARWMMLVGVVLLVLIVVAVAMVFLFGPSALILAATLFILGMVAVVMGASVSKRTATGQREAAAWRGFEAHLKAVAEGKTPEQPEIMEPYLPYAAAFGLEKKWAKRFELAHAPTPAWFHASGGGSSGAEWLAFTAVMHAASSSAGASSAAAGAAAAGGAAGGGSSGAG